jgi:hypothetical protein
MPQADGKPGNIVPESGPIFEAVVVTTEVIRQGETSLHRGYIFQNKKRIPVIARPLKNHAADTWFVMPE